MVFSSAVFLFAFLPVVFLLDRLMPNIRAKNLLLLAASLVFYSFGQLIYLPLLVFSVLLNYCCGLLVVGPHRRAGIAIAVGGNLLLLGIFKYTDFVIQTLDRLTGWDIPLTGIILPVGISFFTFQGMSYVLDAARGTVEASRSFLQVLLYISFFPQLIAGPIVKYREIEWEIKERCTTPKETASGIQRFICGLSKKLLISNAMGRMADTVFALPAGEIGMFAAWTGTVCYTLQIYYDFSGYSDMAIGMGRMFGFHFQENFRYPYTAATVREFWRKWHISLSSWFRDYLYIPLGGNRTGHTWRNRMIVFFTTGLWHGASWNFVLWGLWHGLFSAAEGRGIIPAHRLEGRLAGRCYTMLVVILGFVLFRADTLLHAGAMFAAMFTGFGPAWQGTAAVCALLTPAFLFTFVLAIVLCAPVGKRLTAVRENTGWIEFTGFIGALALLVLCILELSAGTFNPFIYFRF